MKRISEKELVAYIKKFNGKNVVFNFSGIVKAKITMENVKCEYKIQSGILKVQDKNADININISSVYKIQVSENNTLLEICLDDGIDIILEK